MMAAVPYLYVERGVVFDNTPDFYFIAVDRVDLAGKQICNRVVPRGRFNHAGRGKVSLGKINIGAPANKSEAATKSLQHCCGWSPILILRDHRAIEQKCMT